MIEDLFLTSSSNRPKLSIGLVVPEDRALRAIEATRVSLEKCGYVTIAFAICAQRIQAGSAERGIRRWVLDRYAGGTAGPAVACRPPNGTPRPCDVVLNLASAPVDASLERLARFGVWSLRFGDEISEFPDAHYLRETMERRATSRVALIAAPDEEGRCAVLAEATVRNESRISVAKNREIPCSMVPHLVLGALHALHTRGWEEMLQAAPRTDSVRKPAPPELRSVAGILGLGARALAGQLSHRRAIRGTREEWSIGLRSPTRPPGVAAAVDPAGFQWISAPPGHFYADPFPFEHGGRCFLFVEDYVYSRGRAHLAYMEVTSQGVPAEAVPCLEKPYHLSYPHVFADQKEIFMIPETGLNGTVELYRAVDFPRRWRLEKTLFHGPAFDTTLLRRDGTYWFFVSLVDPPGAGSPQLFVFHTDTLLGDWRMHSLNPVTRDVASARCAGAFFTDGEDCIRPAQDGTRTYGGALQFRKLVTLNPSEFVETQVGSLLPEAFPGSIGVHTYNRSELLEALDGKRRVLIQDRNFLRR